MKIIRKIDCFGREFHFLINNHYYFQSLIGGLLTLCLLIFSLTILYLFGRELWRKESPSITTSSVLSSEYEIIDLQRQKMFFAFKVEDTYGKEINSDLFYINVQYLSWNKSGLLYEDIPLTKCSEYDIGEPYSKLYCLNLTNRAIGGNFDGDFMKKFIISINYCPKNTIYYDSTLCTSVDTLSSLLHSIRFSYLKPVLYQQPDNYTHPLIVDYEYTYIDLHFMYMTSEVATFGKYELVDNDHWLLNKEKVSSFYEIDNVRSISEFVYLNGFEEGQKANSLYTLSLVGSKKVKMMTRTYKKVTDIMAIISGIVSLVKIVVWAISFYFNILEQYYSLFTMTFDINVKTAQFNSKKKSPTKIKMTTSPKFDAKVNNYVNTSKVTSNNQANDSTLTNIKMCDSIKASFLKKKNTNGHYNKQRFTLWCFLSKKQNLFVRYALSYIKNRFDITNYNKTLFDIDFLKTLLLSAKQIDILNTNRKIVLNDYDSVVSIQSNRSDTVNRIKHSQQVLSYYQNKSYDTMNKTDRCLYDILSPRLKQAISLCKI